jgi:hypothetical protein
MEGSHMTKNMALGQVNQAFFQVLDEQI